jgi:hypothetical protein
MTRFISIGERLKKGHWRERGGNMNSAQLTRKACLACLLFAFCGEILDTLTTAYALQFPNAEEVSPLGFPGASILAFLLLAVAAAAFRLTESLMNSTVKSLFFVVCAVVMLWFGVGLWFAAIGNIQTVMEHV